MIKLTPFLLLIFLLLGVHTIKAAGTYIKADDPLIQYIGRIDYSNPKQPSYSFPGISIKAKFNGTTITAVIKDFGSGGASTTNYYNVLIDDIVTFKLQVNSSDTLYTLATGLSMGDHTVELIKRTESSVGKSSFLGFVIPGLSLISLPSLPTYKIEFIGDSWTCGYGNEISTNTPNTGFHSIYEDNGRAWGYTVAKKFNAQYYATAISGRGLYRNNTGTTNGVLPNEFNKIFPGQSLPLWNFNNYIPDLVVIHLGTNDFYPETWGTPNMLDSALYVDKYIAFINTLRTNYGASTKIVCAFGNSKSDWYPTNLKHLTRWRNYVTAVVNYFNSNSDNKVYKYELNIQNAPYGEDWHPTIITHNQMANQIAPFIESITGLTATNYEASTAVLTAVNLPSTLSNSFSIYPNPTNGKFILEGIDNQTNWSISDTSGKIHKTGQGEVGTIEELESGIYLLHIGYSPIRIIKF